MAKPNFEKLFHNQHQRVGTTSTSLIFRLKAEDRDEDAWHCLQELYGRLVLDWCKRQNVPKNDRIDVMQDIFFAVSKGIKNFRWGEPGQTFRGWLKAIAHTKIIDKYRDNKNWPQLFSDTHLEDLIAGLTISKKKKSNEENDELDELDDEEKNEDERERNHLVHRAMRMIRNDFEPKTWEAFELTAIQNMTSAEAAKKLGTTDANVRRAKKRILDRLRDIEGFWE